MPRIAVAVGVLALIVGSIGVNIVRYPEVWEMVDPATHPPQSDEAVQESATTEPAAAETSVISPGPIAAEAPQEDRYVYDHEYLQPAEPSPDEGYAPKSYRSGDPAAGVAHEQPAEVPYEYSPQPAVAPSMAPYAADLPRGEPDRSGHGARLVRIVRSEPFPSGSAPVLSVEAAPEVVPLPPVDPARAGPAGIEAFHGVKPFYPTTGVN